MNLKDLINLPGTVLRQQRELQQLRKELDQLRAQNESMRAGMRRCVTCEYRLDYRARMNHDEAPGVNTDSDTGPDAIELDAGQP